MVDRLATFTELTEKMSIDDADMLAIAADIVFDAVNAPAPGGHR